MYGTRSDFQDFGRFRVRGASSCDVLRTRGFSSSSARRSRPPSRPLDHVSSPCGAPTSPCSSRTPERRRARQRTSSRSAAGATFPAVDDDVPRSAYPSVYLKIEAQNATHRQRPRARSGSAFLWRAGPPRSRRSSVPSSPEKGNEYLPPDASTRCLQSTAAATTVDNQTASTSRATRPSSMRLLRLQPVRQTCRECGRPYVIRSGADLAYTSKTTRPTPHIM